jgi:FtsZ-binding cell division protein ZapB
MNVLTGMEKFSHLEDKIYLTIEFAKKLREEKEQFALEASTLRQSAAEAAAANKQLEEKIAVLLSERDSIQSKVEAMLDALTVIDGDVAAAAAK